mgnify:CR=1 FL=1
MLRAGLFTGLSGAAHVAVIAWLVTGAPGEMRPAGTGADEASPAIGVELVLGPAMRAPLRAEAVSDTAPLVDASDDGLAADAVPVQAPPARPPESAPEARQAEDVADAAVSPVPDAPHTRAADTPAPIVMAALVVEEPRRMERLHRQAQQTARLMPPPSHKVATRTRAETKPAAPREPADVPSSPEARSEAASEGAQAAVQPAATGAQAGAGRSAGDGGARGEDLHSAYARALRAAIERQRPPTAGARGTVVVRFTLTPSGTLDALEIARSSGRPQLDGATRRAVEGAAPFARPPAEVAAQGLNFTIAFQYR